jgi:hypothetical protein
MGRTCSCYSFEEIAEFSSMEEADKFRLYIKHELFDGNLEEIKYKPEFSKGKKFTGDWYRCSRCGEVWRFTEPNSISKGSWLKIDL